MPRRFSTRRCVDATMNGDTLVMAAHRGSRPRVTSAQSSIDTTEMGAAPLERMISRSSAQLPPCLVAISRHDLAPRATRGARTSLGRGAPRVAPEPATGGITGPTLGDAADAGAIAIPSVAWVATSHHPAISTVDPAPAEHVLATSSLVAGFRSGEARAASLDRAFALQAEAFSVVDVATASYEIDSAAVEDAMSTQRGAPSSLRDAIGCVADALASKGNASSSNESAMASLPNASATRANTISSLEIASATREDAFATNEIASTSMNGPFGRLDGESQSFAVTFPSSPSTSCRFAPRPGSTDDAFSTAATGGTSFANASCSRAATLLPRWVPSSEAPAAQLLDIEHFPFVAMEPHPIEIDKEERFRAVGTALLGGRTRPPSWKETSFPLERRAFAPEEAAIPLEPRAFPP
jgi:hypothetical protein